MTLKKYMIKFRLESIHYINLTFDFYIDKDFLHRYFVIQLLKLTNIYNIITREALM